MSDPRSGIWSDPGNCPICGDRNECAMAKADDATSECWCMKATIGPDVLSCVPETLRGAACVCARCALDPARRTDTQPP